MVTREWTRDLTPPGSSKGQENPVSLKGKENPCKLKGQENPGCLKENENKGSLKILEICNVVLSCLITVL